MPSPPPLPDPNPTARKDPALPPTAPFEAGPVPPEKAELSIRDKTTKGLPTAVPGYELLGELGRGGMGVVYKARQVKLNRFVALKMVLAGSHASPQEMARFRAEAGAIARLQHANIVQVFEVGEHLGLPFFSMELVTGQNLAERIAVKPLSLARAVRLVEVLARAVHAAHQAGIVHRDLKPANILMARDGSPKITDFGLAKQMDASVVKTQSGAVLGTPAYMAPEQAEGRVHQIGPATDVYALGAILYELITGRPPFQGPNPLATILLVISQEPAPPSRFDPEISLDLETICLKCLHKDPNKRYAKASDVADDLHRCQADEPIRARPISGLERLRRWLHRHAKTLLLTTTLLLSLVGGSYFAIQARLADGRASSATEALTVVSQRAENDATKAREALELAQRRVQETEAEVKSVKEALATRVQRGNEEASSAKQALELAEKRAREAEAAASSAKQALDLAERRGQEKRVLAWAANQRITNHLGMRFVMVPKGTFWLGGRDGKPGDRQLAIKENFYLGATTVTQGQWQAIMGNNPSYFSRKGKGADKVEKISDEDLDQFPVETVSWDDAQAFLKKLNEKAKVRDVEALYRLPTEAEWEYACRGAATSKEDCSYSFYFATPTNDLSSKEANFDGNHPVGNAAAGPYLGRPCKVASYQPNRLGLYDMHGNVWQWCEDKYEEGGSDRVLRGGSWSVGAGGLRAANRDRYSPRYRDHYLGFRVALVSSIGKSK